MDTLTRPRATAPIDIVCVGRAELERVVPLFDAYRVFYDQPSDPSRARAFLSERISRGESVLFLALWGGAPAGFVQIYPAFSSIRAATAWILNDLFVAPRARGRGVATALMQHVQHYGAEIGAVQLSLVTATDNGAAQRLYEKLGWRREEGFRTYVLDVEAMVAGGQHPRAP